MRYTQAKANISSFEMSLVSPGFVKKCVDIILQDAKLV